MEKHQYNVDLTWVADRKGIISSPELHDKLEVATPPEFPKGIEGVWSPEHLFTAAVSSCFMTTFLQLPRIQIWIIKACIARQKVSSPVRKENL